MKLIKISADLELSVHEFPDGSHEEQNKFLRELIGNGCDICEHVMPDRLYTELHMFDRPSKIPGQCVSMLIDEEGRLKENVPNMIGSYGIEDSVFELLELELKNLILTMKTTKEALHK